MNTFRFGLLSGPRQIGMAARAGYDYLEMDLNALGALDESGYRAMASEMEQNRIFAEVVCAPLPADVPILGPEVSAKRVHAALDRSFDLAQALGAELMLFDCPAQRALPRRFDPAMAWRQLGNFVRILQSYAADFDLRVALLPLRRSAAELLNYTSEAALMAAMLQLDRVGVAASGYNMAMEAESLPQLQRAGSLLWHMRTSNVLGNRAPRAGDGEDYAALFAALREMDYAGRVSMEAPCADGGAAAEALNCLREATGRAPKAPCKAP